MHPLSTEVILVLLSISVKTTEGGSKQPRPAEWRLALCCAADDLRCLPQLIAAVGGFFSRAFRHHKGMKPALCQLCVW